MKVTVVYEDNWLLVVNKPSGILTIPAPNQKGRALLQILNQEYRVGQFHIKRGNKEIIYADNPVKLTKSEYMVLELLLENATQTITKEDLIKHLWISGKAPTPNAIDTHVSNIRKKLSLNRGKIIKTVHGIGYKIVPKKSPIYL